MLFYTITLIALILASAFFSASETSLTSASLASITEKSKKGNKSAKIILSLLQDTSSLIITLLTASTFINIFFTTLATSLSIKYFGNNYLFLTGLIIAIIILVFGEIIPKTYAFNRSIGLALWVAPFVYLLVKILKPITKLFLITNKLFLKSISKEPTQANRFDSLENLRGAIELFNNKDSDHAIPEKEMLHSLLDLQDIVIGEIMIHRKNVFCLDIDTPIEGLIPEIINSKYNKIPVYQNSKDNIIGVLYTKEVLKLYFQDKIVDIKTLIHKPTYYPETADALDVLVFLQTSHEKIVIIVDEYGGFMGIICMSDILEEIVGELQLTNVNRIQKVKDSYIVNGELTIRDLNRKLKWNLPDNHATTVAGLILYETGRIPNTGNIFALHGFKFEVLEKKKQQLKKIKISSTNNNN